MKILGLYGAVGWYPTAASKWVHSSGAAYLKDGYLVRAIGEERLTGDKYTGVYPQKAIDYCLDGEEPELVVLATCIHLATQESRAQAEKILSREFPQAQIMLCDGDRRWQLPVGHTASSVRIAGAVFGRSAG